MRGSSSCRRILFLSGAAAFYSGIRSSLVEGLGVWSHHFVVVLFF